MKVSIWQQFSSNHSSNFTVVGVFESTDAADKAAEQVRQILTSIDNWYLTHAEEADELWTESPPPPTPVEAEVGRKLGFEWPAAIEWFRNGEVKVVLDRLVYITPGSFRPDSSGWPFDKVLSALGGQAMIQGHEYGEQVGSIVFDIDCVAPDEASAEAIADELLAYQRLVRHAGPRLHFFDVPFAEFDLPQLVETLESRGCKDIRFRLTPTENTAGKPPDPGSADLLIRLLEKSPRDRQDVLRDLGEIGDPQAVEPLVAALNSPEPWPRGMIVSVLGDIGDARAVEPLLGLLGTPDSLLLRMVVNALGEIGNPRATEPLIPLLQHSDTLVVKAVVTALGKIHDSRAITPLIRLLLNDSVYRLLLSVLGRFGEPARRPLLSAAQSSNPLLARRAQEALTRVDAGRDGKLLLLEVHDEDRLIQGQAVKEAIQGHNLDALVSYLRDPGDDDHYTLRLVLDALVAQLGLAAMPILIELVKDNHSYAVGGLRRLGRDAVPAMVELAKNSALDDQIRDNLTSTLAFMADPQAFDYLIELLQSTTHPNLKSSIIHGLEDIGDSRAIEPLIKVFFEERDWPDYDSTIGKALEKLGALPRLLEPLLVEMQKETGFRPARIKLLGRIGDKRAIPVLLAYSSRVEPYQREFVLKTLRKLGYASESS